MPDSMAFKMFEMHNSISASCFCVRPCRRRYSTRRSMILAQFSDIAVNLLRECCRDSRYRGRDRLCCSRPCCCQRVGRCPRKCSACHPNSPGGLTAFDCSKAPGLGIIRNRAHIRSDHQAGSAAKRRAYQYWPMI